MVIHNSVFVSSFLSSGDEKVTETVRVLRIHKTLLPWQLPFFPIDFSGLFFNLRFETHQAETIIVKRVSKC